MHLVTTDDQAKSPTPGSGAPDRAELPELLDADDERPSITEVNGTVARFDMSFAPDKPMREVFIAPFKARAPSLVYLAFALVVAAVVVTAYNGSSNTRLWVWIVEGDRGRPIGAQPLSILLTVSALGTAIRSWMRGVVVTSEGIQTREVLLLGLPRIKSWAWAQVDRLIVDDRGVMLELWDGRYERLPEVAEPARLSSLLEQVALARGKQVTRLR